MKICVPAMINIRKNTLLFLSENLSLSSESAKYFAQLRLDNLSSNWFKKFGCCQGTFDKKCENQCCYYFLANCKKSNAKVSDFLPFTCNARYH